MVGKKDFKFRLFLLVAVGFVGIVLLVGARAGGATADFLPSSGEVPEGWVVECIDCLRHFSAMSGNSAALDSSGRVHTAYGGDGLYYAVQNPDNSYTTEVVDSNPRRGLNATMVLDSSDRPHIVYYAGDLQRLNYAYFDGANWQISTLSTIDLVTLPNPWLAIDSSDNLHMAFIIGSSVVYGLYDSNSWSFTTVDTDLSGNIGRPSLALDSNERPHIAYGRGGKYANFDGAIWQLTTFPGTYNEGESIALAFDGNERAHIVYQTTGTGSAYLGLRHRFDDGSGWQDELIDDGGIYGEVISNGYDISLGFDSANRPVASYSIRLLSGTPYPWYEYFALLISYRETNGWEHDYYYGIGSALYDSSHNTLLSGPGGNDITIVYKNAYRLNSLVWDGSAFDITEIDEGGISGSFIDMVVDNEDRLHVSAHESESNRLRYALKSEGGWSAETITGGAGFVSRPWTSIAVTSDDWRFIMFDDYDRIGNETPYAVFDGQSWEIFYRLIEAITYQIAADDGRLHTAFYCSYFCDNNGLTYSGATYVELDPAMLARQLDIALDSADLPHIAYPATDGLRYAVKTPTTWMTMTVAGGIVDYPAIALDKDNLPHITWYDYDSQDLRYAAYDGTNWQVLTLDSIGDVGQFSSLAIDRLGRVYISYFDATNADLKYATFDGSSWSTETLLSEGDVGYYSKLVMPYAGYPAIAYYDTTSRDLKLVYRPFAPTVFVYEPFVAKVGP